jgi:hypothetical protein
VFEHFLVLIDMDEIVGAIGSLLLFLGFLGFGCGVVHIDPYFL